MMLSLEKINFLEKSFKKTVKDFTHFEDPYTGIEGNLASVEDTFIILFKPTDNLFKDWITNFLFAKKTMPYEESKKSKVRIHGRYVSGYLNLKKYLHQTYINSRKNKILIIGYSQGGGLAQICALDFQYNFNPEKLEVLTGAGPMVFNKAGVISYNKRVPETIRLVYGNDIVSKAPSLLFGFFHTEKELHFGTSKRWYKFSIKDHYPEKLLEEVKKYTNDNK